jgi:hypothetical protein
MLGVLRRLASSSFHRRQFVDKTGAMARCLQASIRSGLPQRYVYFGHAMGDDLMCTVVLRELRQRGQQRLWMGSLHPSLFEGNDDVDRVVPMSYQFARLLTRLGRRADYVRYPMRPDNGPESLRPTRHIIAHMCEQAAITGQITRKPYLHLTNAEREAGVHFESDRQIAMMSTGLNTLFPLLNKQWLVERWQAASCALQSRGFRVVQLGHAKDPLLEGAALDLRGKVSFRVAAATLARSRLFIGSVGFLMHLARSVDTRSVIVFGGREAPHQSGYSCNENLFTPVPCAPCWMDNACDRQRQCLTDIRVDDVMQAVDRALSRCAVPPEVDVDVI